MVGATRRQDIALANEGARAQRTPRRTSTREESLRQGGHLSWPRIPSTTQACTAVAFTTCCAFRPGRIGTQPRWIIPIWRDGVIPYLGRTRGSATLFQRNPSIYAGRITRGRRESRRVACSYDSRQYPSCGACYPWNRR